MQNINRSYLISLYKSQVKSKWIKDLYIKPGTLKLMVQKVEKSLEHIDSEIFSEQNTNGVCSKINSQQMGPYNTAKLL